MTSGRPYTEDEIINLKSTVVHLMENGSGECTFMGVCKAIGLSRTTAYTWRETDTAFDLAITTALTRDRETLKDLAEGALSRSVKKDEPWAVKFILTMLAKDRGYAMKVINEHTGKNGGAIELKRSYEDEAEAAAAYDAIRKL